MTIAEPIAGLFIRISPRTERSVYSARA